MNPLVAAMMEQNKKNKVVPSHQLNAITALDIISGGWRPGFDGEMICTGGVPATSGYAGPPNCGKTELVLDLIIKVAVRYGNAFLNYIETEKTTDPNRVANKIDVLGLSEKLKVLNEYNYTDPEARFSFTDGIGVDISEWEVKARNHIQNTFRIDHEKGGVKFTKSNSYILPYPNLAGEQQRALSPLITIWDSFNNTYVKSAEDTLEQGLDDKSANRVNMVLPLRRGLFIRKCLKLYDMGGMYSMFTAAMSEAINPAIGPGMHMQKKTVAHMAANQKFPGMPKEFLQNLHQVYTLSVSKPFYRGTSPDQKFPMYPYSPKDTTPGNTDLEFNNVTLIRGKNTLSGVTVPIVRWQTKGLDEFLTNLNLMRTVGPSALQNYGISKVGMGRFEFDLYPGIVWTNNTIKSMSLEDPMMVKAVEFTMAMKLVLHLSKDSIANDLQLTPKEVYTLITEQGIDMNKVLTTRSYALPLEQHTSPTELPFLSVIDLLKVAKGIRIPEFLK